MVYVEFQKMSTGWNGRDYSGPKEVIPALGSDGVYVLDGRNRPSTWVADARKRANVIAATSPGIVGFKLHRGRTFSDSRPIDGKLYTIDG